VNPRRILYHHRIRADDGQAVHVREMIGALRAAGHQVLECALVPKTDVQQVQDSESGAGAASFWKNLRLPRFAIECAEVLYSAKGQSMILAAAKKFQPDFVYERHALHCRSGLFAARALGVPLLLEVNSPMCDEMDRLNLLRFQNRGRRAEREVLAGADRVLAVSDVLANRLSDLGADSSRLRVIRNGADPARLDAHARQAGQDLRVRLGLSDKDFVVGFIGYMRDWHRLDRVIEAMRQVQIEALHFVVVGDGPALPDLMERAAAANLSGQVHALGAVSGAEVPGVCSSFDATLIPAINEYASPLKMFDSLAAGITTLAVDQANIRELITDGETGVLFDPTDENGLAQHLQSLVNDPDAARAIGMAGRDSLLANDWTWAGNARRVVEAYEDL
jgi:glycosyltransferase involved in cell wall biosynthesis